MELHSYANRPQKNPEVHGGVSMCERAGYISAHKRIVQLMTAGKRLRAFREEQFDWTGEDKIDENFSDPTRNKEFDMADASQLLLHLADEKEEEKKEETTVVPEKKELKEKVVEVVDETVDGKTDETEVE